MVQQNNKRYALYLLLRSDLREQQKISSFIAILLPLAAAITYTALREYRQDESQAAFDIQSSSIFRANAQRRNAFLHLRHRNLQPLENFQTLFKQNFDGRSFEDYTSSSEGAFELFAHQSGDGANYFFSVLCQRLWSKQALALCLNTQDEQYAQKTALKEVYGNEFLAPALSYVQLKEQLKKAQGQAAPFLVLVDYRCADQILLEKLLELYSLFRIKILWSCKLFARFPQDTIQLNNMLFGNYQTVSFAYFKPEKQNHLSTYLQGIIGADKLQPKVRLDWNIVALLAQEKNSAHLYQQPNKFQSITQQLNVTRQQDQQSGFYALSQLKKILGPEELANHCYEIDGGYVFLRNDCYC